MSTRTASHQIRDITENLLTAYGVEAPEIVPDILRALQHPELRCQEIVFDLRGFNAEALKALIMGAISEPEFGELRNHVRFIE